MQTTTAETLVPGCPSSVHDAVLALAARLWGVEADDVITSEAGELFVHGVRLDGETGCWLTWRFEVAGVSLTRVHLSHSDAALDAGGPEPELDSVLGMLLAAGMAEQSREGQTREGKS
jgi:hypothetical protein